MTPCLTLLLGQLLPRSMFTQLLGQLILSYIIYLDFAKAFDKVPHFRLIKKLKAHGVDGNVAKWIFFLVNWKEAASSY